MPLKLLIDTSILTAMDSLGILLLTNLSKYDGSVKSSQFSHLCIALFGHRLVRLERKPRYKNENQNKSLFCLLRIPLQWRLSYSVRTFNYDIREIIVKSTNVKKVLCCW